LEISVKSWERGEGFRLCVLFIIHICRNVDVIWINFPSS
jgi:hypothetical protein